MKEKISIHGILVEEPVCADCESENVSLINPEYGIYECNDCYCAFNFMHIEAI